MSQQILRGAPATVSIQLADQDGNPRPATGPVTVTAIRSDGTAMLSGAATNEASDGTVTATLTPAQTNSLDLLKLTWTEAGGATIESSVEVVGGFLFSLVEARDSSTKLRDPAKYSDNDLLVARRAVTEECEKITGRSFVPRFRRIRLSGRYGSVLDVPDTDLRQLRDVSIDALPMTGALFNSLILNPFGQLRMAEGYFNYGESNVEVAYEYGMDYPPQRIKEAALLRLQSMAALKKTGVPERAEYQIIEGRVFSLNRLRGGLTGIKEVDDAYSEWRVSGRTVASVPLR